MATRFNHNPTQRLKEDEKYFRGEIENSDLRKKDVIRSRPLFMDLRGPERFKDTAPDKFKR